jgi:hypothetical protein
MVHASLRVSPLVPCALLLVAAAPQTFGQTPTPPDLSVIMVTQVKPDARADYEAYQKEVTAAYKKAGVRSRIVLESIFGDLTQYVSITPLTKFAEMDGAGPLERALGAEGAAKLRRRGSAYLTSIHRYASVAQPDLSIRTPVEQPYPYALVSHYRLVAGKAQEFANFIKTEYLPVMKKGDVANLWVSQTIFGGSGERVIVRPMRKLGEFDDGPVARRVLGPGGAQTLNAKQAGIVESVHSEVLRYRADLSYEAPRTQTTAQR